MRLLQTGTGNRCLRTSRKALRSIMPFDRANIMLYLPEEEGIRPFVRSGPKVVPEQFRKRVLPREGSMLGYVLDQKKPVIQTFD